MESDMRGGRTTEEMFNAALGHALRRTRVHWSTHRECIHVEETHLLHGGSGQKPDLLINDGLFPPVIIECSFSALDADQDASNRLGVETRQGRHRICTALALSIPPTFRDVPGFAIQDLLEKGTPIQYAVHQILDRRGQTSLTDTHHRRWPRKGFIVGTVDDLSALLPSTGLPQEIVEDIADHVALLVKEASIGLELALPAAQQEEIARHLHQRSPLKGLRTMMVLWLNALLTQQRLASQGVPGVPHLDLTGTSDPDLREQMQTWQTINRRNWNSVFAPAMDVLHLAGRFHPAETARMLSKLIHGVLEIETAQLGLHISVGAELFPKLSEDRKQAAAFYTQAATAELLAGLTIERSMFPASEWADPSFFRHHRLSDLACGTGTLLRAGYTRVSTLHEQSGGDQSSLRQLHAGAMEGGLIGADISPMAAHLTTSSLAALGHGEPYGETQIGWIEVGGGKAQTGSLEYFATERVVDLFHVGSGTSTGNGGGESSVSIQDASLDWVLMNPPYSRTRGGQSVFDVAGLTESERRACQRRWKELVQHEPVNNQAGLAASFLALARRKCRPGGRMGFVLPLSAAFAESWAVTRQMMEREFTDILAIAVASGQALGRQALSADTGMEEMLLVATRQADNGRKTNHIHCLTLRAPVLRVGEAGEVARAIRQAYRKMDAPSYPVRVGDDELGQLCTLPVLCDGAPWNSLGVLHAELARAARSLLDGNIVFNQHTESLGIEMGTIGELFQVGPTHHLIGHLTGQSPIGAFEFSPVVDAVDAIGSDRSLWRADGTTQTRLQIPLTHKGFAPIGVGSEAKRARMQKYRSTLFYARNMRWTSQALLAATTKYPGMGGRAWASLQHEDERVCKAFALWANSTPGLLIHWTQGQRTQSGRATTQMKALALIPCPRLDQLSRTQLDQAATAFDKLRDRKLLPACQGHADETRKTLDATVLNILGLKQDHITEIIPTLRWLWANEPSVHGQNQKALKLLK